MAIQGLSYFDGQNLGEDFARLGNTTDGWLDEVYGSGDSLGADLIHLFVDSQGNCTSTSVIGTASTGGRYAVTKWNAGNGYVFAHETGHNLGCYHGFGTDESTNYNHAWEASHTFFDIGSLMNKTFKVQTVMWATAGSTMIPAFSSPQATYTFHSDAEGDASEGLGSEEHSNNTRYRREQIKQRVKDRPPVFFTDSQKPNSGEASPLNPSGSLNGVFLT